MDANLENFITFCQQVQPYTPEPISRFFAAVRGFPYDKELLLQAYLYFHIQTLFPACTQLLLFEQSLVRGRTDLSKCDLIYLTQARELYFIETKFIDTEASGSTERTRRTQHRKKVLAQVLILKELIQQHWQISPEACHFGVFTTDVSLGERADDLGITARAIAIRDLWQWHQEQEKETA